MIAGNETETKTKINLITKMEPKEFLHSARHYYLGHYVYTACTRMLDDRIEVVQSFCSLLLGDSVYVHYMLCMVYDCNL